MIIYTEAVRFVPGAIVQKPDLTPACKAGTNRQSATVFS
jgi:hypothetical protein